MVLQVGYVGTLGRRLLSLRDINQAALGSRFNNSEVVTPSGGVFSFQQASRPYFSQFPNFGVIDEIQSIGTSSYNGLQTTLRTTSWHGLISQFNYTYAHSLDEVTQYVGALPQDSTNFYGDYGNSDYDIRHHFNSYLIYDIPGSSHGPHWLSNGWQANGNISFRTGEPFSIHASSDTSGTAENTDRGVQVGNPFSGVSHALTNHQPVQWINPASYTNAPNGSFGTVARNSVVGPGYGDVDFSIFKNTTIHESIRTRSAPSFSTCSIVPTWPLPRGPSGVASGKAATPLETTAARRVSALVNPSTFSWLSRSCSERDHAIHQDRTHHIRRSCDT